MDGITFEDVRRARKSVIQKVRRFYKTQGINIMASTSQFPSASSKTPQEMVESLYDYYSQMLGRGVDKSLVAKAYQGGGYSLETGEIFETINIAPSQADYIARFMSRIEDLGQEEFTNIVGEQIDNYIDMIGREALDELIAEHQDIADDLYSDLYYAESYAHGRPYAVNYALDKAMSNFARNMSKYIGEI